MPKEKIWDEAGLYDVEIGWAPHPETPGCVQVGISSHEGVPLSTLVGDTTFTSLWATVDRASINRMIHALRKARDAAYGRDE